MLSYFAAAAVGAALFLLYWRGISAVLTKPETVEHVIHGFLDERTVAYVTPVEWREDLKAWIFAAHNVGTRHPVQNVYIHAQDNRLGERAQAPVVAGITMNPHPISGYHFPQKDAMFVYKASGPYDEDLSFIIEETNGTVEQRLRIVMNRESDTWRVASLVGDPKTGEVLLGCQDAEVDLWRNNSKSLDLAGCGPFSFPLFTAANVVPERTRRFAEKK